MLRRIHGYRCSLTQNSHRMKQSRCGLGSGLPIDPKVKMARRYTGGKAERSCQIGTIPRADRAAEKGERQPGMETAAGGLAPSQSEFDIRQRPASATAGAPGKTRSRWPEWCAFFAYAALVAFAIPFHEPFADEAQAWQLARSLSLGSLFKTYIRYEGSPGLWHFLLWILIRIHVGYAGIHWICGGIAVAATALLIFKSPFPRYLKLTLPFTVFLVYQYAVVARNYVLAPILLYLVAMCWKRSPLILALLLGLLANVSLHASVMSGGLAIVYLVEQVRHGDAKDPRRQRQLLPGAVILLALWAFAIWTAWPPHDFSNHLSACLRSSPLLILRGAVGSLVLGMFYPWILSVAFWVVLVNCLRARRSLLYLLPVLFFAIFAGIAGLTWWHVGLLIPLIICIFWITWPAPGAKVSQPEIYGRTALVAMTIMQILWACYAIEFDHYHAFSPDRATAEFLRPYVRQGARIAVTYAYDPEGHGFFSIGILPYFDHNIFINLPEPFWSWRNGDLSEEMFAKVLPTRPNVVVVEQNSNDPGLPIDMLNPKIRLLNQDGYRFTHMFCGVMPVGFELVGKSCQLIFQRGDSG